LVAVHGVRRDLFVRVSQTEVRLPPLRERLGDARRVVADVLYDLVRVAPERLPELRGEARRRAEEWRRELGTPLAPAYDLFAEALSYVMWRERKNLAAAAQSRVWRDHLTTDLGPGNFRALRERVAAMFDDFAGAAPLATVGLRDRVFEPRSEASRPAAGAEQVPRVAQSGAARLPTNLSRDDLLRWYYQSLLSEERGDLRRVAARAGRRMRSLHAELARLGVRLSNLAAYSQSEDA
jgi:DNA-binding NtrC family response regulator